MENRGANKRGLAWGWVVALLVLFWPLGLLALYHKLNADKSASFKCGKILRIVSYLLMFFGAIYISLVLTDGVTYITPAILFGGGGLLLNHYARKTKKRSERYKKYIMLVINQNQTSIDSIASAMGIAYEMAVKDLQKMIDSGYLPASHIDITARKIVTIAAKTSQTTEQAQAKVLTCESCGANNRIEAGQIAECEYCGSPL